MRVRTSPFAPFTVIKMRKFKYAPTAIPPLTEEQWKMLEEAMNRPMTEKDKELWRRAQEVFKAIKVCKP